MLDAGGPIFVSLLVTLQRKCSPPDARYTAVVMTAPKLTKEGVRAFLDRPWHLFEKAHAKRRREAYEADPGAAFRASEELWEEVCRHGYPDAQRRRRDFEDHVRLRALLDRANLDHEAR